MKKEYVKDLNKKSDWGIVETNKFKISNKAKPRVWTIDNFYDNPDEVREFALGQYYWDYGMNGRFQSNIAGSPTAHHCDSQQWAAMIYLTPNAPFSAGTRIIANKKNKIYHNEQGEVLDFFPNQKTFTDGTLFETVDMIGNVYNRLAIFDAGSLHCAGDYFGWDIASGRLWQMFFFDADLNK